MRNTSLHPRMPGLDDLNRARLGRLIAGTPPTELPPTLEELLRKLDGTTGQPANPPPRNLN